MKFILSKIHIIFLLVGALNLFSAYEEYEEKMTIISGQKPAIRLQIKRTKKKLKQLINYYKDIEKAKERIQKVSTEVADIQKQLPADINDPENLLYFSNIASNLNIKDIYMTPGKEENHGFYVSKKYNIKASGTFLQFLILLEKINESSRLMNIDSIALEQKSNKQRGRFQIISGNINVEVYRYNNDHQESSGIKEIEEKYKKKTPVRGRRRRKRRRG